MSQQESPPAEKKEPAPTPAEKKEEPTPAPAPAAAKEEPKKEPAPAPAAPKEEPKKEPAPAPAAPKEEPKKEEPAPAPAAPTEEPKKEPAPAPAPAAPKEEPKKEEPAPAPAAPKEEPKKEPAPAPAPAAPKEEPKKEPAPAPAAPKEEPKKEPAPAPAAPKEEPKKEEPAPAPAAPKEEPKKDEPAPAAPVEKKDPEGSSKAVDVNVSFESQLQVSRSQFRFSVNLEQEALLEALKSECVKQLNTKPTGAVCLTWASADGGVLLTSDRQLRDVFLSVLDSGDKSLNLTLSEAQPTVVKEVSVHCSFKTEKASFVFKYDPACDQLLESFKEACRSQFEEYGGGEISMTALLDGEEVPLTHDNQLRDVVQAVLERKVQLAVTLTEGRRPSAIYKRVAVEARKRGAQSESAKFSFRFNVDAAGVLEAFLQECRGELDLFPDEEIVLRSGETDNAAAPSEPLSDARLKELLQNCLVEPVHPLVVTVEVASDQIPEFHVTFICEFESAASFPIPMDFTLDSEGLVDRLKQSIRKEAKKDDSAFLVIEHGMTQIGTDDDFLDAFTTREDKFNIRARVLLPPASDELLQTNRMAEINALASEWADIIDETGFAAADVRQLIEGFRVDGRLLTAADPLSKHMEAFTASGDRLPADQLPASLQTWTNHMPDEQLSLFCHHCRNVIDLFVEVSPVSKLRRSLSITFRAIAVGGSINVDEFKRLLKATGRVAEEDLKEVFDGLSGTLGFQDFSQIMFQLFADSPQEIVDVLAVVQNLDQGSPSRHRAQSRKLDAIRKRRLVCDIRHSLDAVTLTNLETFGMDFAGKVDEVAAAVAYCVLVLLKPSFVAIHDEAQCLEHLATTCKDGPKAAVLYERMKSTSMSSCNREALAKVAVKIFSPELDPSALLPKSPVPQHLRVVGNLCSACDVPTAPVDVAIPINHVCGLLCSESQACALAIQTKTSTAIQCINFSRDHMPCAQGTTLSCRTCATICMAPSSSRPKTNRNRSANFLRKQHRKSSQNLRSQLPRPLLQRKSQRKSQLPLLQLRRKSRRKSQHPRPAAPKEEPKKEEPAPAPARSEGGAKERASTRTCSSEGGAKERASSRTCSSKGRAKERASTRTCSSEGGAKERASSRTCSSEGRAEEGASTSSRSRRSERRTEERASTSSRARRSERRAEERRASTCTRRSEGGAKERASTRTCSSEGGAKERASSRTCSSKGRAKERASSRTCSSKGRAKERASSRTCSSEGRAEEGASTSSRSRRSERRTEERASTSSRTRSSEGRAEERASTSSRARRSERRAEERGASTGTPPAPKEEPKKEPAPAPAPAAPKEEPKKEPAPAPAAPKEEPKKEPAPAPAAPKEEPKKEEPAPAPAAPKEEPKKEPAPAPASPKEEPKK